MSLRARLSAGLLLVFLPAVAHGIIRGAEERGVGRVAAAFSAEGGRFRALVIGIDGYTQWPRLKFAEADARDIRDILTGSYGFAPEDVSSLIGADATESRIFSRLRDVLFDDSASDDSVFIYFAGHGQIDPATDAGFWIPIGGALADESTWIPLSRVQDLLTAEAANPKHIVVVTDSCFGGALTTRSGPPPLGPRPGDTRYAETLRAMATRRSVQVIASGGFETVPDKSEFAELLKQALRSNDHGAVDMEFLFWTRVYPPLRAIGQQSPTMTRLGFRPGQDGQFVLMRRTLGPEV
jgi:hypothetical protein